MCFFHLVLAGRHTVWGFEVVSAVLFLSFGVSCLLDWLGQPFFVCHQHSWFGLSFCHAGICVRSLSFTVFSAVGIRVRLFIFALLALVSGYQCISQFLVSCRALAARHLHLWRFELEFFPSRLPCGQPYKFRFEANPIWYSAIKFTKSHSAKCSLHKCAWLRRSIKLSSFELYKFDPFSPHNGSIPRELVHSYALGCLWVVTVCCNTIGRLVRSFCRPHAYTFSEQSKMATALTPQADVTSEKVTWLMENPSQQSRPAYRK